MKEKFAKLIECKKPYDTGIDRWLYWAYLYWRDFRRAVLDDFYHDCWFLFWNSVRKKQAEVERRWSNISRRGVEADVAISQLVTSQLFMAWE